MAIPHLQFFKNFLQFFQGRAEFFDILASQAGEQYFHIGFIDFECLAAGVFFRPV